MAKTETTTVADHDDDVAHHPDERQYVMIGLILAGITAVEVGLYYFKLADVLNNVSLLVLSALKFVLVAMYFMHLKFDQPILRRLFTTGIVLAIGVYMAYLLMLHKFIS